MPLPPLLEQALALGALWKYLLIFIATPLGGPTLILATGFLLRLDLLEFLPLFLVLALGELLLDALWYYIGYSHADRLVMRWGKFFGLTPAVFNKAKELLHKYHGSVLFTSKVMMGFGMIIAILITAGATRMPFWRYMAINAVGEVVWLCAILGIGYSLGEFYIHVADDFKVLFLVGAAVAITAVLYGGSRYMRGKVLDES